MILSPLDVAVIALAGGGVGVVAGTFGIGGGFLLVPVLTLLFDDLPMDVAVGAAACQALGPATTALLSRRVEVADLRLPAVLLGGLLTGVLAGVSTLVWASDVAPSGEGAPFVERLVLWVYLVLLVGLGSFAVWETGRAARGNPVPRGWIRNPVPPRGRFKPELGPEPMSIPVLVWFGVAVGFLSGLLGISGGLVLLPGIVYLFGVPAQEAVRSSLIVVWMISLLATGVHAWNDHVDLWLVSALLLGGTLGARVGSTLGTRLGAAGLRRRFGWLLLGAAAMVVVKLCR